jgi:hypothetical protein
LRAREKCNRLKLLLTNPSPEVDLISNHRYSDDIIIINDQIDHNTFHYLSASADINILPSLRIHAHTMLTSLSVGHACFGTSTFGFSDFISDNGTLFDAPIAGTNLDENYGSVTNGTNIGKYMFDFDNLKNSTKFVNDIADMVIELYNNRNILRQMRYNSYIKNINEFSIEQHQNLLYNIITDNNLVNKK